MAGSEAACRGKERLREPQREVPRAGWELKSARDRKKSEDQYFTYGWKVFDGRGTGDSGPAITAPKSPNLSYGRAAEGCAGWPCNSGSRAANDVPAPAGREVAGGAAEKAVIPTALKTSGGKAKLRLHARARSPASSPTSWGRGEVCPLLSLEGTWDSAEPAGMLHVEHSRRPDFLEGETGIHGKREVFSGAR